MTLASSLCPSRRWRRKWVLAVAGAVFCSCLLCTMVLTSYDSARHHQLLFTNLVLWGSRIHPENSRGGKEEKDSEHKKDFRWFQGLPAESSNWPDYSEMYGGDEGDYNDFVDPVSASVLKQMQYYPARAYTEKVLILSPIHNVEKLLPHYADMLKSLTYPRSLLSVALGEDSSTDDTMTVAKHIGRDLSKHFTKVLTHHLNITGGVHGDWETIHDREAQLFRRSHLADARNLLLDSSLTDEDWVLWVDSDVDSMPPDIIQQLLSAQKDIVAPVCLMRDEETGGKRIYDKNTWRETEQSLKRQKALPPDDLVLEGYGPSYRTWLSELRGEGRVVPLDGVGGCTLLIRADCHRKGLVFPNFVYDHHIETEGLAKMAKNMKFGVYGMPFVEVMHS